MPSNTKFKTENNTVKLSSVTKYYGNFKGIEDISISVQKGEVFGLLGTNGAGKTTILRIIMGLIKPTKGTISIFGTDLTNYLDKTKIGYLQGDYSTYNGMKVRDLLYFINKIRNVNIDNSNNLCERFSLNQERKIGELSKGNKQKLGIVQAFMSNPDLLLLSSGYDAHVSDPLGGMNLSTRGFSEIIKGLQEVSKECCQGRIIAVTEGGYNLGALEECLAVTLEIMTGATFDSSEGDREATELAQTSLSKVVSAQASFWPGL